MSAHKRLKTILGLLENSDFLELGAYAVRRWSQELAGEFKKTNLERGASRAVDDLIDRAQGLSDRVDFHRVSTQLHFLQVMLPPNVALLGVGIASLGVAGTHWADSADTFPVRVAALCLLSLMSGIAALWRAIGVFVAFGLSRFWLLEARDSLLTSNRNVASPSQGDSVPESVGKGVSEGKPSPTQQR